MSSMTTDPTDLATPAATQAPELVTQTPSDMPTPCAAIHTWSEVMPPGTALFPRRWDIDEVLESGSSQPIASQKHIPRKMHNIIGHEGQTSRATKVEAYISRPPSNTIRLTYTTSLSKYKKQVIKTLEITNSFACPAMSLPCFLDGECGSPFAAHCLLPAKLADQPFLFQFGPMTDFVSSEAWVRKEGRK